MAMAATAKKLKTEDTSRSSLLTEFKKNSQKFNTFVYDVKKLLKYKNNLEVCPLTITNCLADCDIPFSRVVCRTERCGEALYPLSDLFQPGRVLLREYMENLDFKPQRKAEEVALEKLLRFWLNIEDAGACLMNRMMGHEKVPESKWAPMLGQHLLSKLAVNPSFVVDDRYNKDQSLHPVCPCGHCGLVLDGLYGDTSIGNVEVWHGTLDILVGDQPVILEGEPEERNGSAPVEIKSQDTLMAQRDQILAQTIVFSFFHKNRHPEDKIALTPCIGISKENVVVFFYDCHHDILLESTPMKLFYTRGLDKGTILALWLVINYKYLRSGITQAIKSSGYTAGFEKFAKKKLPIYQYRLSTACGCASDRTMGYLLPGSGSDWTYKTGSEPVD